MTVCATVQAKVIRRRCMRSDAEAMMTRAIILAAVLATSGLGFAAGSTAQDMLRHIDLSAPDMVAAEMTRAEVEAMLAAATPSRPADFTSKKLSGLDLSGLDLSGAVLRAARLNKT